MNMNISNSIDYVEKKIEAAFGVEQPTLSNGLTESKAVSDAKPAAAQADSTTKETAPVKIEPIPLSVEVETVATVAAEVTVLLIKEHTHEGKKLLAGVELKVRKETARWLELLRVAVSK